MDVDGIVIDEDDDPALTQLLRDAERICAGILAIGEAAIELDTLALVALERHVRRG